MDLRNTYHITHEHQLRNTLLAVIAAPVAVFSVWVSLAALPALTEMYDGGGEQFASVMFALLACVSITTVFAATIALLNAIDSRGTWKG